MKTTWKRIITAILCAVIAVTSAGSATAYAAGKKTPLKVAFNGVSVNLVKDLKSGGSPKLKTVEEKWGRPNKINDGYYKEYVWKKGRTSIKITDHGDGLAGGITINIKDKNGAMCGVKFGMKKETAVKKMQKMFGKKKVAVAKEGQICEHDYDSGTTVITGEPTGDGEYFQVFNDYAMPFSFTLTDGKVSEMYFWVS